MRKGTVVSLKNFKLTDFFVKNNILVILVVLFIAGIAVGTFSEPKISRLSEYAADFLKSYIADRTDASFLSVALHSFMSSMLILLAVFAAGASMLGVVLVPVIPFLRGMFYGCLSAQLYSEYAVKGVAFNAVMVIPSAIILIIALLLASRESVKFSLVLAKMSLPTAPVANLSQDFKNYCGRYLFICFIALASALIDAVLSCTLMANFLL